MTSTAHTLLAEAARSFAAVVEVADQVEAAAAAICAALAQGNKVLFCGNGGSAADSQHLAAELVGRFVKERDALPAIALTVDTSALTAIANDYGFDTVFARQVRGLGRAGDVLVGLSTSGRSANVLAAMEAAKAQGLVTVAMTGAKESPMSELADIAIRVPATVTARIQEMHIAIGHTLCAIVDDTVAAPG